MQDMCLPNGKYDFMVRDAVSKTSKSGNEMIELEVQVYGNDGRAHPMRDWLVSSDQPLCQMKVRHFCRAVDLMASYEAGTLSSQECVGVSGRCVVKVTDDGYGPQNKISDYVPTEDQTANETAEMPIVPKNVPYDGDNMPF